MRKYNRIAAGLLCAAVVAAGPVQALSYDPGVVLSETSVSDKGVLYAAAASPTVSLTSGSVQAGGDVTLTLNVEGNPGMAACLIYFYYDTSVFTVDPARDIAAQGAFRSSGGLIGNSIALARENGRYAGDTGKDGALALWYNGSGLNTDGDGTMMTITLHANDTAAGGVYEIGVGYSADDVCSESGKLVALRTSGGSVTVSNPDGTTPVQPEQPAQPEQGTGGISTGTIEQPETEGVQFSDVAGNWAEAYIEQAAARGLIVGYNGLYRPNDQMSRAEFVTILWSAAGSPAPKAPATFTDLTQAWYQNPIAWAQENNVVSGVGGGKFDPNGTVTREQIAAILHRMAGSPTGMELMFSSMYDAQYGDSGAIGSWAKPALYWSIFNEIYCGEQTVAVGQTLAPKAAASRAQIAVMMVRYLDSIS